MSDFGTAQLLEQVSNPQLLREHCLRTPQARPSLDDPAVILFVEGDLILGAQSNIPNVRVVIADADQESTVSHPTGLPQGVFVSSCQPRVHPIDHVGHRCIHEHHAATAE